MAFDVGATVTVLSLGRKRGTVVHAGRGGRYRVQVEGVTFTCREQDLAAPEPARRAKSQRSTDPPDAPVGSSASAPPGRIDLHGLAVDDAIERLTDTIDTALRRGADRVDVVHGKGTGRVRDAVHRHLATLPIVATFRLDPSNPGVTIVWLR